MTENEALVFLSINEGEDLISAYENKVFEFKQYFSTKPLVPSLFNKRIDKLRKVEEAVVSLGLETEKPIEFIQIQASFSSYILESYFEFEKLYSHFKLDVYKSNSVGELIQRVNSFLTVSMNYFRLWPSFNQFQNTVILAKQPDPMELIADIKYAKEKGICTFEELANDLTEEFALLKNESTRLNKLFNMGL